MKIGILGATGAVGRQMLICIEERKLQPSEVRLFASERSVGKKIPFAGTELTVEMVSQERLKGLDYVLGAVSNSLSKEYRPMIEKAGAVYIDNSSAFRMEEDVPLVIPEINGKDLQGHHRVIANPNCSTIITLMALAPIAELSKITAVNACTYQAVSGAGMNGISELEDEIEAVRKKEEVHPHVFPAQIAYSCIADIGTMLDSGYTTEEMKMQNEGRKILHLPDMKVTCTCVRVPVFRSHSISVTFQTEKKIAIAEAEKAVASFAGDVLCTDHIPSPLETSDQDLVYVGRIRQDLCNEKGLVLWCCGDQIRKGAASNAVQIIEYLDHEAD
ncbi:MAG: aspartate-semialdehyde dehydrogenase [Solobacterium sp.]|jgi:aspartate-semialdehyde dehydrogenase|nr:aspartate-semialdehyde dehydrogenase [Solobacterium sp.]MCH4206066.1 aspartate-semialdehyde dehydrogenase [Solobacterium sp.]MCH4227490.1 aspartate-semialdehyde dehydrogenase [Solobacterium sp.]MCH4282914.1 aspartate-semialdehyde dehydrogenase [Solobacterium sp.]